MFVVLEPIDESESLIGKLPKATAFDQPPLLVGSKVSLGGEPRWTVVESNQDLGMELHGSIAANWRNLARV
jgi:hypothetical protein